MIGSSRRRKPMSEINVVPYIDVTLVLLVIFMVTAPLLTQGVQVDLPKATARVIPEREQEPMIISVNAKGQYFLNISENPGKQILPKELMLRVAAELNRDPKRMVLVKGDQAVDYGQVVTAMVLLQQAGAPSVGLMTETPHG